MNYVLCKLVKMIFDALGLRMVHTAKGGNIICIILNCFYKKLCCNDNLICN